MAPLIAPSFQMGWESFAGSENCFLLSLIYVVLGMFRNNNPMRG